ncbi:MAG: cytochrome c oxidase subunit II [Chloroflexi bacterium]|nr:cytochrome c oxidase subunit II [Chloroflexota bacterium]
MSTKTTMHIDPYERTWIWISIGLIVVLFIAVSVAGFALGIQVPTLEQRVDPNTVADVGNWADPGLRELAPGKYEVYILAQTWQFIPDKITVPVGSEVTFYVTSKDVQHGFKLQDTNINMMVIPGQVSKLSAIFDTPGTYNFICTEYCGNGHAIMYGTLIVEP